MFRRLTLRLRDMRTITALCRSAELHANAEGRQAPGSEHFVMAAMDLPDGTAQRAFRRANADPARFRQAIVQQYARALRSAGIDASLFEDDAPAMPEAKGLYKAEDSARQLVERLARLRREEPARPLLGADVIAVAAESRHGITARAIEAMGLDAATLRAAAQAEIEASAGE
ncbi:MAG: Clp protease N-terminal domain-containing protein [Pseudomonadota bacterium]